ncbi:MAG: phosphoribosylformylglycinamidine synthase I [bacterium]
MNRPKAVILRTAGTNCDWETCYAFEVAGAKAEAVHVNRLIKGEVRLDNYQIMAIPGGFSYGDDIASGKILANELKYKLGDSIKKFAKSGNPVIGICNGFQVLVKMGLLPGNKELKQVTTLTFNDSDKFECRWVYLTKVKTQKSKIKNEKTKCLWVKNLPEIIQLPVAHGEGKFVASDKDILKELKTNNQIVFIYSGQDGKPAGYPFNPNGAVENIAGICNDKGNVFGLMPHPERFIWKWQHPSRQGIENEFGWGLQIFKNAVEYCRR